MKVWVNVDRKKAILAGKNEEGWKLAEVDMGKLSQDEREYVAGRSSERHGDYGYAQEIGGSVAEATEAAAIQCVREQIVTLREVAEREKKETEKRTAEILSKKAEEYVYEGWITYKNTGMKGYTYSQYSLEVNGETSQSPRIVQLRAAVRAECDARNEVVYQALLKKSQDAEQEKKKLTEESAKKEAVKKAQIAKWVAEKGTENQKKRYEIGLLPETEVVDAIRDEAYKTLDGFPRYEKMQASDVCTCEEHYNNEGALTECDVDYEVYKATEATAEEYGALEKIADAAKKAHPGAVITMTDHVGTSEDCENEVIRKSVKVEIEVGAFKFSREYAI